jgi:hypothetical protein
VQTIKWANTLKMKKRLHITATLDEPILLQNLVEKLAYRRYDIGYSKLPVPAGYIGVETSTTEAYVSGTLQLNVIHGAPINMPFITCFLFTCIKNNSEPYHLTWSISFN